MKKSKKSTEQVNNEAEILKNQLVRALADYDNLQKRTSEEKVTWIKFAVSKFIENLLPILDVFEASLKHTNDQGLAIGIMQLKDLMKNEGLTEIAPKEGEDFSEELHEVVEVVENDEKSGKIAELLLSGWRYTNGPVLRHARVKVYKGLDK